MNTKAEIKAEQIEKKFARVSPVTRTLCKNIYDLFFKNWARSSRRREEHV